MFPLPSSLEVHALVRDAEVHKDLYTSEALFRLEQEQFFGRVWNFAGHGSQIPQPGDYLTVDIAGQPLLVVRDRDGTIRAFFNRCPHKGTRLYTEPSGRANGRVLVCPYHAWSFRLDGGLAGTPLDEGYAGTGLDGAEAGRGLAVVPGLHVHRDFIFVRLSPDGIGFSEYFGDVLRAIDNMVERSPTGELQVEGGILRNEIRCNWKLYVENINDSVHPVSAHASAVRAATTVWRDAPPDAPKPIAIEQILPFGQRYEFFKDMGSRVYPNGHSVCGTKFSIHSGYGQLQDYVQALTDARGEQRAKEILERSPQNTVLYPSLALKGSPQTIRVIRPLAVDRTIIEAWSFRTVGGPDLLHDRALTYGRLVFSPMSIVAHDDVHLFESQQIGLGSRGSDWVSLHRDFDPAELGQTGGEGNGTTERLLRNQYRAWARFMTDGTGAR
jgi:phenylpropionate dioxygenase-like ring-hydroxylating dioxygenase large terminal subunit